MKKPEEKPPCYGKMDLDRHFDCAHCEWINECYDKSFVWIETVNGDGYRDDE